MKALTAFWFIMWVTGVKMDFSTLSSFFKACKDPFLAPVINETSPPVILNVVENISNHTKYINVTWSTLSSLQSDSFLGISSSSTIASLLGWSSAWMSRAYSSSTSRLSCDESSTWQICACRPTKSASALSTPSAVAALTSKKFFPGHIRWSLHVGGWNVIYS